MFCSFYFLLTFPISNCLLGNTGCSLMILEKYQIPTLTRKQSVSLKWCHFLPYPSPFWYLVSKKIHNHSVIIHLVRLLRCETVKIWKIHWKLKYSESQYCFANISATEARIFMKFYVMVNSYLASLSFKFHEDPDSNARVRVINARKEGPFLLMTCKKSCNQCL